jgi:antitoxin ParD1/3/4
LHAIRLFAAFTKLSINKPYNQQKRGHRHNICYIVNMTQASVTKPDSMSINVRVSGALKRHVETTTSEGDFESVSEYVRDLIRKDKAAQEEAAFQAVKAHLHAAFSVPESEYELVSADDIRALAKPYLK